MAKDYYEIDPSDPPSLKEIVKRWADNSEKATDAHFHLYLPIDVLYKAREVDRAKYEMRAMEDHEWEKLKKSLSKRKWDPEKPAILTIGKDGCIYLSGGNHRATLAKKVGLEKAPVKLIFNQKACDRDNAVQVYDSPENLQEWSDEIAGGLADLCEPEDFNPKQVKMGTEVEMEHTDDPQKAMEIALDHLKEDPEYYTKLKKIEPKHFNESHASYEVDNQMFSNPAGGHFEEEDIKLGGHEHFHDRSRKAVRDNRPDPIIDGLFESEDDQLDQANHLYENPNLTFNELLSIFKKASSGNLKAIERPDGYSFYLSFRDGEVRFARSKTEMKEGGLTLDKITRKKFKGKRFLKDCRDALYNLERALYSIDDQLKSRIFQDGTVFYKTILTNPDRSDFIDYDSEYLTIQQLGHYKVDSDSDNVQRTNTRSTKKYSQYLDKVIEDIENEYASRKFQIQRTAVRNLQKIDTKEPLQKASQKLSQALRRYNLNGSDTIGDFMSARIENMVSASKDSLPDSLVKLVSRIITGEAGHEDIPDDISKENRETIENLITDHETKKDYLQTAIWPVKRVVKNFTSRILRGLESAYVLSDESDKRVRERIEQAARAIHNYDGEDADKYKDQLLKQLKSIEDMKSLSLPFRDLTFMYDGRLYKFSGNYNPVKNILKMYENELDFSDTLQENKDYFRTQDKRTHGLSDRSVAVIPGAFKPPHMGHFELAAHMINMREANGERVVEDLIIMISPKSRTGHGHDSRIVITAEMSKQLWELFTDGMPRVQVHISEYESPLRTTFDFMEEKLDEGDTLWVAQGDKDEDSSSVSKLQDYSDARNLGINVEVETTDLYGEGVSSTQMRHYLATGNQDAFMGYMPDHLTKKERRLCYEIIKNGQPDHSILEEMKIPLIETHEEKETIEELAGGYSSHAAQMGPIRNEPNRSIEVDRPTPHQKPHTDGNAEIEEEETSNRQVNHIKSLKKNLKKLETQARKTNDNDKLESLNKQIEEVRNQLDQALDKLLQYYINNFSELEIDEISGMGAGAVAGTPNPGHGANAQNAEAIKQAQRNRQ